MGYLVVPCVVFNYLVVGLKVPCSVFKHFVGLEVPYSFVFFSVLLTTL